MSISVVRGPAGGKESASVLSMEDVVEVPLLLPTWQVEAFEALAHARGLTAAEMLRRLLADFIACANAG